MSNSTAEQLFDQWKGKVVPRSFNGGLVTLSYIVSVIGAASALELINRRTSPKGTFNNLLLVGSAILLGGISIWGMHYIGNRAINILDGSAPELLHIMYSPGFTALSFFVPIVVLLAAFMAIGTRNPVRYWRIALGGVISGAAICGMHYLGNASIKNYICVYDIRNVIGAAVIAVAASSIALLLFFVFRASWTNSWWKKAFAALLLAGATSGMHWCAATGTQYILVSLDGINDELAGKSAVIVVICLTASACIILAGCCVYTARRLNNYAVKAQHVTLAAAVFDKQGRILVSPDGLLPSEIITESFVEKNPQESFSTAHSLFHWMFQASRSWDSIDRLMNDMERHLSLLARVNARRDASRTGVRLTSENGEPIDNYELVFRELFCSAAHGLVDKMRTSLLQAGILWDEIVPTGATPGVSCQPRQREARRHGIRVPRLRKGILLSSDSYDRAEKGSFRVWGAQPDVGRGSVMFLVRHTTSMHEIESLEAAGFRFAELDQVSSIIGSSMRTDSKYIRDRLKDMAMYTDEDSMLGPGVHLGFFGIRARVKSSFGFDVLVRREARNLLPSVPMLPGSLEPWQLTFLSRLNHLTSDEIARSLGNTKLLPPAQALFASQLLESLKLLRSSVDHTLFDDATLSARAVEVPCRPGIGRLTPNKAVMIVLCRVIPIHVNANDNIKCEFIPLNFFKTHQLVYRGLPQQRDFSSHIHLEMLPVLGTLPLRRPRTTARTASGRRRATLAEIGDAAGARRFRFLPKRSGTATRYRSSDPEETPVTGACARRSSDSLPASEHSNATVDFWRKGKNKERDDGDDDNEDDGGGGGGHGQNGAGDRAVAMDTLVPFSKLASGILVSQEVTVDVQEVGEGSTSPYPTVASNGQFPAPERVLFEPGKMGRFSHDDDHQRVDDAAGPANTMEFDAFHSGVHVSSITARRLANDPSPTFVDELFNICVEGR